MSAPHTVLLSVDAASLVKVVIRQDNQWLSPEPNATFQISRGAEFPEIVFEIETPHTGDIHWTWAASWVAKVSGLRESSARKGALRTFRASGSGSYGKRWVADLHGQVLGGTLEVTAVAGETTFKRKVEIKGINPSKDEVRRFLDSLSDVAGFDTIIEQESRHKHFINADGQPVVAFDGGYGITQLTNPTPDYQQAWSWKENIRAGAKLYQEKQRLAKHYLGRSGRQYTDDQLRLETWARWNGGRYHVWDDATGTWQRDDDVLCDSRTGNIGWDMTLEDNQGKTEAELRKRDRGTYANPRDKAAENKWKYTGICYADHLDEQ